MANVKMSAKKRVKTRATLLPGWLGYEFRRVGAAALATPLVVGALFVAASALMALSGAEKEQMAGYLTAGLEIILPLATGIAVGRVVSEEPVVELQLTLWTGYQRALLRRLGLLIAWTISVGLAWAALLGLAGMWAVPGSFLIGQLGWLAPLCWFFSLGALLALVLRSSTASSAVLGGVWLFELMLGGLFYTTDWLRPIFLFATTFTPAADYWAFNRLVLIAISIVLGVVFWALLRRSELVSNLSNGSET
ncbi:hypothetical protein [Rubrobacter aplysinae]|uniref:hypothetical protein n=1 Tax=Rubrobacter aplysinae TaxID=909625 RepID=UPI00064C174C|nr:hypothetical protein [Rubrobacter aplysinae]